MIKPIPITKFKLYDELNYIWNFQLKKWTNRKVSRKTYEFLKAYEADFFIDLKNNKVYSYGEREGYIYRIELFDDLEKEILKEYQKEKL
jgi:hypothetical protein